MGLKIKNLNVILTVGEKKFQEAKNKFEIAVNDEVTKMILRTRAGKDINNQSFKEYTPKYAAYRSKKGRNIDPVDLQFTGKMLSAITTKTTETKDKITVTVFFNSVRESVKAAGNLIKRNFFGFSDEQKEKLKRKIVGG